MVTFKKAVQKTTDVVLVGAVVVSALVGAYTIGVSIGEAIRNKNN